MADFVRADGPESAIKAVLLSASVAACKSREEYAAFKYLANAELRTASEVFIAGSGNWGFSLDPGNLLRPFGDHSDRDLAVIDEESFLRIWGELRQFHRESFYSLSWELREMLRRNGENIYAGFVSPMWIPDRRHPSRGSFLRIMNRLSNEYVDYKPVKMLLFRNFTEAVDYYKRGVMKLMRHLNI